MKKRKVYISFILILLATSVFKLEPVNCQSSDWKAQWITSVQNQNESNTWICFRKDFTVYDKPEKAFSKIAVDSKYWLWINDELVVFEGGLKRGPNPLDTYFDEIDIAPYLQNGKNTLAILVWYYGKDSFSHKSSGQAGLIFDCQAENFVLLSDKSWQSKIELGYFHSLPPYPNFRLSESNVCFDARKGNFDWLKSESKIKWGHAVELGIPPVKPWNNLVRRPIPQWKNYGIREYENSKDLPKQSTGDWIICELPYNGHITPVLDIEAPEGLSIKMQTDNYDYLGSEKLSVRAEYITKEGHQEYESLGWMNGHIVKYLIPKGVKINALKYRETGFNSEFTGYFNCSDEFYNKLWQKAVRTLYVTMRDTYMDCPDRERAQWWGDLVNESGESFYALSPSSSTITQKGILELINWQREDGTLFSPVPAGNWNKELPGQMLASIGYYGFWNYYLNTGDKETIAKVYKGVKRYLDVWKLNSSGVLAERQGDWYWGDWGRKVDKQLLFNAWYYLALKGYLNMSLLLNENTVAEQVKKDMDAFKTSFNLVFWDGKGYRTKEYTGDYDDRGQALAIVSGLAEKDKNEQILKIFKTSFLASPYMEKYVLEALFVMGEDEYGLERMKKRYYNMIEYSPYSTLYENFGGGEDRTGYGTNNHAWSGGGLTILSQYVCGLFPVEAGWKSFMVKPQMAKLKFAETGNETISGKVSVRIEKNKSGMEMILFVPGESTAIVYVPKQYKKISINDKLIYDRKFITNEYPEFEGNDDNFNMFKVNAGKYLIKAK